MRWCTKQMKILPLEKYIGDDEAVSYIGIRADEHRDGYISKKPNITPVFPFKQRGLVKTDIYRLLEESGIGLPDYYRWRSRSGCFFCFFSVSMSGLSWRRSTQTCLRKRLKYEQDHADGRTYTWTEGETLLELLERKDQIIADHERGDGATAANRLLIGLWRMC